MRVVSRSGARHMVKLVWALGVKHLFTHRARLALSAVGVASGVALATAVSALSTSIDASLEGVATAVASRANLEVRALTQAGVPQEVVINLREVEGVRAAGATVESYTKLKSRRGEKRTLLLGVDPGMAALAPRSFDPSVLRHADFSGLLLPASLARDLGVNKGDEVQVATQSGWRSVPVGLILPAEVAGSSRSTIATIGIAQQLLGKSGMVDAVYVEAINPETVLPALRRAAGDGTQVGPLALRKGEVKEMVGTAITILGAGSILALFVGGFLVFNTMFMAAVERSEEAAILRAIGASRAHVLLLFLSEGGLLGVVGSALGLGIGVVVASTVLVSRGSALEDVYPVEFTRFVLHPRDVVIVLLGGVAAAVLASVMPARRLSRVDPVSVLGQVGALEDPIRRPRMLTLVAAIVLLLLGGGVATSFVTSGALGSVGYIAFLAGMVLLIPRLVPALAQLVVRSLKRSSLGRRGIFRLAAEELVRAPSRTSLTAGAVLLSLSIVVALGIGYSSFSRTFRADTESWHRADLFVKSATWRPYGSDVPLDGSLAGELRKVPGVAGVYSFRLASVSIDGHLVGVGGLDRQNLNRLPGLPRADLLRAERTAKTLSKPGAIIISRSASNLLGLKVGDQVNLPTPTGTVRRQVAEIRNDVSDISPQFTLEFEELSRLWGSELADSFGVGVVAGADVSKVRRAIISRFGREAGVVVQTREQSLREINSMADAVLGLLSSVQFVAVVVAGLGLANTLLMSTIERRRELGVMRAVGMLKREVRRMVTTEAMIVVGIAVVLAWLVGTFIGIWVHGAVEASVGEMQLVFPPLGYVFSGLLGLAAGGVAAMYPAHRAARTEVIEALHYE